MGSLVPERLIELGMERSAKTQDVRSGPEIHPGNEEKGEEHNRHKGKPSADSHHRRLSFYGIN